MRCDVDDVVTRYQRGESLRGIARIYGVSDSIISGILSDRSIVKRSNAEANALITQNLTEAERRARRSKFTRKWENIVISECLPKPGSRNLVGAAQTRQITRSMQQPYERDVLAMFTGFLKLKEQVAVDRYNVDFACGSVAVEVHQAGVHPFWSEKTCSRVIDVAERGYHVVYLWTRADRYPLTGVGIEQVAAHVKRLHADPAVTRQYLVVSGSGELVSAGQLDTIQRVFIPATVDT
jgi:very-short-patch-repair endonuclease